MKYLDSSVFISASGTQSDQGKKAYAIILDVSANRESGATCALTWDEVTYAAKKIGGGKNATELAYLQSSKFLSIPHLEILPVSKDTLGMAQELMKKYDLGPRDAIHAASAILNNIKEIVSSDSDFGRIKELKWIKI